MIRDHRTATSELDGTLDGMTRNSGTTQPPNSARRETRPGSDGPEA